MRPQTWVEIETYNNGGPLGSEIGRPMAEGKGLRGDRGDQRRTEKLVEGRWLVRWWRRDR